STARRARSWARSSSTSSPARRARRSSPDTASAAHEDPPPLDPAAGRARRAAGRPAARGDGAPGRVERLLGPDHLGVLARGAATEPADLTDQPRGLRAAGRADGAAARPHRRTRHVAGALARADPAGPAAGGRRRRTSVHLRAPGTAGPAPGGAGCADRLLDRRGGARADLRGPALPGAQPGGGSAHGRHPLRAGRRLARGAPLPRPHPRHASAGAARPALRHRALLRPCARGVRRDDHLRRLPAGHHPHPAAGDLPAARERSGGRGGALLRADARRGRGDRPRAPEAERMSLVLRAAVAERHVELDLEVGHGETLALVGPNGAGKSTALSLISGDLRPSSGSVSLDGRILADEGTWVPPHDRRVTTLSQDPVLFPHLSALGNVVFPLRAQGVPRGDARRRALEHLDALGLADLAARRPAQLSGGQAQRVAIARALAADPRLLLLDEPMAALDVDVAPALREQLRGFLAGRTAIVVTHDVLDALSLAERVVVLEQGRQVDAGPTTE